MAVIFVVVDMMNAQFAPRFGASLAAYLTSVIVSLSYLPLEPIVKYVRIRFARFSTFPTVGVFALTPFTIAFHITKVSEVFFYFCSHSTNYLATIQTLYFKSIARTVPARATLVAAKRVGSICGFGHKTLDLLVAMSASNDGSILKPFARTFVSAEVVRATSMLVRGLIEHPAAMVARKRHDIRRKLIVALMAAKMILASLVSRFRFSEFNSALVATGQNRHTILTNKTSTESARLSLSKRHSDPVDAGIIAQFLHAILYRFDIPIIPKDIRFYNVHP